jgi:hypothetical protein
MSHGPNRYRAEKRAAEWANDRTGPSKPATVRAQSIVSAWNARARRGEPAEFFPTFETVLAAGCWRLSYCCPACRQMATVDVRDFAEKHHPQAPVSMLIPKLSCKQCCPNPPLATLQELGRPQGYSSETLAAFPIDPVRIACNRCDRRGQYRKARLLEMFGSEIVGPDLLRRIANCDRQSSMNDPCGAHFADLAAALAGKTVL